MGHINPTLKLARQLARRGHQVSYLTLPDLEEHVRAQQMGFVPVFSAECPRGTLKRMAELRLHYLQALIGGGADPASLVAGIVAAIQQAAPDVLLIDQVLQDLAQVALRLGLTHAVIASTLSEIRFNMIGPGPRPEVRRTELVLCPRAFEFPHLAARPDRHYVEAFIDLERQEAGRSPLPPLDGSKQLVYCSLGSHPQDYPEAATFFRAVVGAARERPRWQLLLAPGPVFLSDPALADLPPNVVAVEWVPQLAVLERAAAMITHGGLGTVKECIYFGVPMIVFPMAFDQGDNATRIVYHGLGLRGVGSAADPGKILSLVDRVLEDPAFRARAGAMSAVFRQAEGDGLALRVVEDLVRRAASPAETAGTAGP